MLKGIVEYVQFIFLLLITYFPLSAVYIGVETIQEEIGENINSYSYSKKLDVPIEVRTNIYVTFSKKHPSYSAIYYENIKQPELINNVMQLIRSNLRKELPPRKGGLEEVHFEDIRTQKHVTLLENLYNRFYEYYKSDASLDIRASRNTHDQDMSQTSQVIFLFKPSQEASQIIVDKLLSLQNKFSFFREELQQEARIRTHYFTSSGRKSSMSINDEGYYDKRMGASYYSNEDENSEFEDNSSEEDEGKFNKYIF